MATRLTQSVVRDLAPPPSGSRIEYDTELKGFGVRVTANAVKAFVLNYRTKSGRERRFKIGMYPAWGVSAARQEAKELLQRIARGEDPQGERVNDRTAPTVADLCALYVEEHLPHKRPSSQAEDHSMIAMHVLPVLKHLKVAEVDHGHINALHRKITKAGKPFRANRVLAVLSKMFSLATLWKLRSNNPCKSVKRNTEEGRERYLEPDEIARLMKALAGLGDQESANAIMLALLTGARRGELLRATWAQFDLKKGIWTKPSAHTKQKKTHRVPLSLEAWQLLTAMRAAAPDATHLFPGRINAKGDVSIRQPWKDVCEAAGLRDVRFHDLRHSYASLLVGGGSSLPIVGRLLGHTQAQTTLRYAHIADDPLREATGRVGRFVGGTRR